MTPDLFSFFELSESLWATPQVFHVPIWWVHHSASTSLLRWPRLSAAKALFFPRVLRKPLVAMKQEGGFLNSEGL
jgi:hypothetical protein